MFYEHIPPFYFVVFCDFFVVFNTNVLKTKTYFVFCIYIYLFFLSFSFSVIHMCSEDACVHNSNNIIFHIL
jgi:hypothetical protein